MYSVAVDAARSRVIVAITGFIPEAEAGTFTEAIRQSVQTLGRDAGQHDILCELTSRDVAAAELVKSLQAALVDPRHARLRARRIAIVAPTGLAQARNGMAVFAERSAAEQWLDGHEHA